MSVDGYVQVAPDSTGKKIDNTELTRADGTIVERQRVVLADPDSASSFAGVTHAGEIKVRQDRFFEYAYLRNIDSAAAAFVVRKESFQLVDRRGGTGRGSTR